MKNSIKSFVHNGPVFPAEQTVIADVIVAGEELSPLGKRMLYRWAAIANTDYVKSKQFQKNFYHDFKTQLSKEQQKLNWPEDFKDVIEEIRARQAAEKEKKAEWRRAHKDEILEKKEKMSERYGYAIVDGKKQPLGGYMIEPEGIYIGRGKLPVSGYWKYEVLPEDVSINFFSSNPDDKPPAAPEGHHWKEVVANHNSYNAVYYKMNVGNKFFIPKKIRFGSRSDQQIEKTKQKFAKARKLSLNWDGMMKHIMNGMKSADPIRQQSALVSWLILNTGIRIGHEMDEEWDSGVVGASTLKVENISFEE